MTRAAAKRVTRRRGDGIVERDAGLRPRYESDVPIGTLLPYPGNPKEHDIGAIITSIENNGVADAIRVQQSTRFVLGGHGTLEAFRQLGFKSVPVLWIDCDDRTARRLVLVYNRSTELGGFNQHALLDFLSETAQSDTLLGTGYDGDDVDALRDALSPPPDLMSEWHGMPDYQQGDQMPYRTIYVHFNSDADAEDFAQRIGQSITDKTKYLWHPAQERVSVQELRYSADASASEVEAQHARAEHTRRDDDAGDDVTRAPLSL